jgi:hypothetical protein
VNKTLQALGVPLEVSQYIQELESELVKSNAAFTQIMKVNGSMGERNLRLNGLLQKAAEVIKWKSLYPKAEMGWYAEALVADIENAPEPDNAFHGRRWYEHYRAALDRSTPTSEAVK